MTNYTLPIQSKEPIPLELPPIKGTTSGSYWTNARIQKTAMGVLATLSFAGTGILFTAIAITSLSPLAGFGAIPLVALGTYLCVKIYQTKDYDDPVELAKYREDCKYLTLPQIIDLHGADNTFKKQLLSQEGFIRKYKDEEITSGWGFSSGLKPIPDLVQLYNKYTAYAAGTNYQVPHPSRHLKKLQESCSEMTLDQISKTHTLEYMFAWGLVTQEEFIQKYNQKLENLFGLLDIQALYAKVSLAKTGSIAGTLYTIPAPSDLIPSIKKECEKEEVSLGEIIRLHGYHNLCAFKLLSEKSFELKYQAHMELLFLSSGLTGAIDFYENMKKAALKAPFYTIPDPSSLSATWLSHVSDKSAIEILEKFDLENLIKLEILPEGKYRTLLLDLKAQKLQIDTACAEKKGRADEVYRKAEQTALNAKSTGIVITNSALSALENAADRIRRDLHILQNKQKEAGHEFSDYLRLNSLIEELSDNARAQEKQKAAKEGFNRTYNLAIGSAETIKSESYNLAAREKDTAYRELNRTHVEKK